ncbi:MAG: Eco57I restriction-modification methylase domain-containing protein [Bacteroidales bacterium]|nr:Eco57I restriction-modification methylase domain-containing protein [Bacteroidales bacterium]
MQLKSLIEKLHLSDKRGVIFKKANFAWKNVDFFSVEHKNKLQKINPDAVYHFNKQPFILFFDLKTNPKNTNTFFKQVWNWDTVPVIFVINPDAGLSVYNAFHYQKNIGLEKLEFKTEDEIYNQFSFWELQSGGTLNYLIKKKYLKKEKRINKVLNENISKARKHLAIDIKKPLSVEFTNLLILRLIFIRYLIDRKVKINKKYVSGKNITEIKESFYKLIKNKDNLISFFEYLKERFNGSLFETANDESFNKEHLTFLSDFFSANLEIKQQVIKGEGFDIFDFSIIPVETISGIYESVIDTKKRKILSAVYTPLFLVDYILGKTVDKHLTNSSNLDCRILDASCGSGIFLTQTYRHLVENEIAKKGNISDNRLIEIAKKNLFGIDKDINALHVAAFSIYISILDFKEPAELDDKKFNLPDLIGENLLHNDFFNEEKSDTEIKKAKELKYYSYNLKFKSIKFDFILGNPPWGRKNDKTEDWFHLNYKQNYKLPLSNDEISQSFLFRSKDFQTNECALIVSSKAFYNKSKKDDEKDFKKVFFQNFLVHEIFDLSAARRMVFDGAISPAVVVFYKKSDSESIKQNVINHISVKANRFLKELKTIVIEEPDKKEISQKHFIDYSWMMKLALYGNTYDYNLLKNLLESKTLKTYFNNTDNIFYGDGIKKYIKTQKKEILHKAKEIEEKNISVLEFYEITQYYTKKKEKKITKNEIFEIKLWRNLSLFENCRILLKARPKNESDIFISFCDYNSLYREKVLGIASSNTNLLYEMYGSMLSGFYTYFQFLTSSSWGVFFPEILQDEYLSFPYKETEKKKELISTVEKFIELFKNHYKKELLPGNAPTYENSEQFRQLFDKINATVNETYNINSVEKDMIDYVLDVSRYQFQEGKLHMILRPLNRTTDIKYLKKYAKIFFNHFSESYDGTYGEYFKTEVFHLNYFVAMKFIITNEKPSEDEQISFSYNNDEKSLFKILADNFSLKNINEHDLTNKIFIQKNIKGFEPDFFYIIKPNEYKSWHRAMAHYDIAWFDNEMIKAEIEEITDNE